MELFVFLPQMRLDMDALVARAQAAEAAGFDGMALMDHLAPPLAEDQPMFESMATTAWLLANTSRLRVGALVLCDAFRHPAVLAQAAVTLDHASGGRFELGIGAGSVPTELDLFGVRPTTPKDRVDRLAETLTILEGLWTGEVVDHDGEHFQLRGARQAPGPLTSIPLVIGGVRPRMLELVRRHADWWNLSVGDFDRFDELRAEVGDARPSLQQMIGLVTDGADRAAVAAQAARRFPNLRDVTFVGTPAEVGEYLAGLEDRGVERTYLWFTDFAPPETLARFAEVTAAR